MILSVPNIDQISIKICSMPSISRLLIANRGEIACRIIKTARRMNIETIAIYSDVDRDAMHVKMADEAHYIGQAEPQKSYLNQKKILELALRHKVSAIHPGYGFLSENAEFSRQCLDNSIIFVGPSAASIRAMGIKNESKRIMIEANVSVVPGYHGNNQDANLLNEEARKIGYPVLIKPVRGGGGKGMRIVRNDKDFLDELESSKRESTKSFGDESMLLERFIEKPRHIEVQVFGDTHGNHVHLYERDCSIQRRHQKIIEEAPAPLLEDDRRQELGRQAIAAAKAVNYVGAGTVEFILDRQTNEFYFMEMNTRLQVEHPITELITDTDLVEWQLRVAAGETLPKKQSDLSISGHAFEARVYAEDPEDGFLPQTGQLDYIKMPKNVQDPFKERTTNKWDKDSIRLDTGVVTGDTVSPYYDPMIAKLIVWDEDRRKALEKLSSALDDYTIHGVSTNLSFLSRLAENESFVSADVGTDFIDLHQEDLFEKQQADSINRYKSDLEIATILASIRLMLSNQSSESVSKFRQELTGFRMIGIKRPIYSFRLDTENEKQLEIEYSIHKELMRLKLFSDNQCIRDTSAQVKLEDQGQINVLLQNTKAYRFDVDEMPILRDTKKRQTLVTLRRGAMPRKVITRFAFEGVFDHGNESDEQASSLNPLVACAPMPGIVDKLLVQVDDIVKEGQSLIVLSAMKMEYVLKACSNGRVKELKHKVGDFVSKDAILVQLEPESVPIQSPT